ncbi:MAG: hypothetical protein PHY26_04315, partial [Bacilli bacterium]|nr:hypothetical protein [Bacilli bacterium]
MRKINSLKNFVSNIIPFFIIAILGFIKVDVFLNQLGIEIFAINQLFFQLFSYLSLLEAGAGVLITQQYFQYLVDANHEKINAVFNYSVKYLRKLSIIIIIIGVFLSFFLHYMTNNQLPILFMQIVFILFLLKNVVDYFMFSPRFVLQADQKIYKINLKVNLSKIIEISCEIILLLIGFNYIIILIVGIIIRVIFNHLINKKIFKEYPWLKVSNEQNVKKIYGMKSAFIHKITGAVYNNTDIIIISSLLEPIKVVIYSSYRYIIKFITDLVFMLSGAITSSFGNVSYQENKKDQYMIFEEMNALFLFCAMFFSITIFVVTDSFIGLWIGQDKILDELSFILMIMAMFYTIARKPFIIMRDVVNLFGVTKTITIMESILNLILSFILIYYLGMVGILLATVISFFITTFWFYPKYIYNNIYNISAGKYFVKYLACFSISALISIVSIQFFDIMNVNSFLSWFLVSCV